MPRRSLTGSLPVTSWPSISMRAGGRLDQPVDHLQRRRLAAPRRPDQDDQLAAGDVEVELLDGDRAVVVGLADPREADHGRRGHGRPPSCGRRSEQALVLEELPGRRPRASCARGRPGRSSSARSSVVSASESSLKTSSRSGLSARKSAFTAGVRFWAGWMPLSSSSSTRPSSPRRAVGGAGLAELDLALLDGVLDLGAAEAERHDLGDVEAVDVLEPALAVGPALAVRRARRA